MRVSIPQVTLTQESSSELLFSTSQELERQGRINDQEEAEEEEQQIESRVPIGFENVPLLPEDGNNAETPIAESQSDTEQLTTESAATTGDLASDTEGPTQTSEDSAEVSATEPVSTTPRSPEEDPNFLTLTENVESTANKQSKHIPASKASEQGQTAAEVPPKERESEAQTQQVEQMEAQEAGEFDAEKFKQQLMARIEQMQLPEDEEQADEFDKNNNIDEVTTAGVQDAVNEKNNASGAIETTTKREPDTSKTEKRTAQKLPKADPGERPASPEASKAMPPPRGDAEVSKPLQDNMQSVEDQMQQNEVTDEQLSIANEPTFSQALSDKNEAKAHTESAPGQFREAESEELQKSQSNADGKGSQAFGFMHSIRGGAMAKMFGTQQETGTKDTSERQQVIDTINTKYEAVKVKVESILNGLEEQVEKIFNAGAVLAKKAFEGHVARKMEAYKEERYGSSWLDWRQLRRVGDYIGGLPDEVNAFFVSGREVYINKMDEVITIIAQLVAAKLTEAKNEITKGRDEINTYVMGLSPALRKVGQEAAQNIQKKFDDLESDINSKQDELIDSLAQQYVENLQAVDARIEEMKAENSGLIDKALNAITGVIETINQIRTLFAELLASAMDVISAIIADPIGFLSNLIDGIGQGLKNFGANILKHLQSGLIGWLTGTLGPAGITIPDDLFSLQGIFSLITQILGFTWQRIRNAGRKVLGEKVMKALETGFELVMILKNEGLTGLWEHIKEEFTDLKETVMGSIKEMVITQVIEAGIKWVLSLLNPASAFVKAAMAIVSVVKFFIERAAQVIELVKAFIEAISAIASGSVQKVAEAIENALSRALPIVIGFLAALLGLGGLAGKVIKLIKKIQKRVEDALIKLWKKIKNMAKGFIDKVKKKLGIGKKKEKDELSKEEKKENLNMAVSEGTQLLKNDNLNKEEINDDLEKIKDRYGLEELNIVTDSSNEEKEVVHIHGEINPDEDGDKVERDIGKGSIINGRMLDNDEVHTEKELEFADEEEREGGKIKGYKVKAENSSNDFDGIIVGKSENNYIRERAEKEDYLEEYNILKGKTVQERRKHIDKVEVHTDFKPKKIELELISENKLQVKYFYEKEAHENGRQDFTVTISLDNIKDRKVTQTTEGKNLALKVPGTRGYTDSANKIAKDEYGIELNSAHILGDQFLGSGYKDALNLVLTSKEFNQQTMKAAETQIQDSIKQRMKENADKFVTFDMVVSATFEVLPDDELIETLAGVSGEMTDVIKKKTLEKLQAKQDPRRCEIVEYAAKLKINGKAQSGFITAESSEPDKWLNGLFDID